MSPFSSAAKLSENGLFFLPFIHPFFPLFFKTATPSETHAQQGITALSPCISYERQKRLFLTHVGDGRLAPAHSPPCVSL